MSGMWQGGSAAALGAEILLCELQGSRLAEAHGLSGEGLCLYCGFPAQCCDQVIPVALQSFGGMNVVCALILVCWYGRVICARGYWASDILAR